MDYRLGGPRFDNRDFRVIAPINGTDSLVVHKFGAD
jgi:hypothetical protein